MHHKLRPIVPALVSLTLCVVGNGLLGCSGDTTGTAPSQASTAYYALTLNEHAINMSLTSPANTMQLIATPRNGKDESLITAGQAIFRATDSSVTVTAAGVVTAHYTTTTGTTQVIASLQVGNVTHADTAIVCVTANAPAEAIKTFSIQPGAGDSAVGAFNTSYTPTVTATNSLGAIVPFSAPAVGSDAFYALSTSNPTIASYNSNNPGQFSLNDTGHVTLYATSWVYGISVRDSLRYKVVWPISTVIYAYNNPSGPFFRAGPYYLGVGAVVNWVDAVPAGDSLDILFDHPEVADSAADVVYGNYSGTGNLYFPPIGVNVYARKFATAGTYHFYNVRYPTIQVTLYVLNNSK